MRKILLMMTAAVLLGGCGLLPEEEDETLDWSPQKLYSEAHAAMQGSDFEKAIKYFEILDSRYPFGAYAQQAQIELGYSYYKSDEPESALATLDRFLKRHPRHEHADYAYYLKGLVNFNRGAGLMDRLVEVDDTQRDPGAALNSFDDFQAVLNRFPDSTYANDARQRMVHLKNRLAQYEVNVAEYYVRRRAFVAAANRAKYVLENYQGTPATADSLSLLAQSYLKLDMQELAGDAQRVLAANFPDHPGVENPGSLIDQSVNPVWDWIGLDE